MTVTVAVVTTPDGEVTHVNVYMGTLEPEVAQEHTTEKLVSEAGIGGEDIRQAIADGVLFITVKTAEV